MSEIERVTREIHISARMRTEMFAEGEFTYRPIGEYYNQHKIAIKALYVESNGEEYTVPEALVSITYTPLDGQSTEYIFNPTDLSKVEVREQPKKGIFKLFSKPHTEATEKELITLERVLTLMHPTREFGGELAKGDEELERERERSRRHNRIINESIKRRQIEALEEEKAKNIAVNILQNLTPEDDCLGIVVDDYRPKIYGEDGLIEDYAESNRDCKISFSLLSDSEQAVRVISHIQKLKAEKANNLPVIVFMDGMLGKTKYPTGIETTEALKERLEKESLPMPYLVGNSSDNIYNTALKKDHPEHYITSFDYGEAGWSAIVNAIKKIN